METDILQMDSSELLELSPKDFYHILTPEELVHIATKLGAFWRYDYEALRQGKPGLHALLKSGRHSDGFFISRILLEPENIRRIVCTQMADKIGQSLWMAERPDYIIGVPDGATEIGRLIAEILEIPILPMEKVNGQIIPISEIPAEAKLLLVEDFCTRGTGFAEAVLALKNNQPTVSFVPINPVIINRGPLGYFSVEGIGIFQIRPLASWPVRDWAPEECPLCQQGSQPIKPKASDDNWRAITKSQL